MKIELAAVEYNHEHQCYVAILTDGEQVRLESTDLRNAELEAERILEHEMGEYSRFIAVRGWE